VRAAGLCGPSPRACGLNILARPAFFLRARGPGPNCHPYKERFKMKEGTTSTTINTKDKESTGGKSNSKT